jgi:multiple sugar transport system substrate-binding protein
MLSSAVLGLSGCSSSTPSANTTPGKPWAGTALEVTCQDTVLAKRLSAQALAWSAKSGAVVRVVVKSPAEATEADVVVLPASEFGRYGNQLQPLPGSFKTNDHALARGRMAETYRDTLTTWQGDVQGLPVVGDGFVLVFRADRFALDANAGEFSKQFGRTLMAPATYDDIRDIAAFFHKLDGKPSLTGLRNSADRLWQFQQLAACYDRKAISEIDANRGAGKNLGSALSFHFDSNTGQCRFPQPAFIAAAQWLGDTQAFRATIDDPVQALDSGTAVLGILSMRDLGRLPRDPSTEAVSARFGIAPLPGTRTYFDSEGKPQPAIGGANTIPFLGSNSMIGAVKKTCKNPQAAWEFLAEIAGPTGSLATLSDTATGCGPFRREHIDESRDANWLSYRFDATNSQKLAEAMRKNLALNISNPVTVLRLPDASERLAALDQHLNEMLAGKINPTEAMKRSTDAWNALDAKLTPEARDQNRRHALGVK